MNDLYGGPFNTRALFFACVRSFLHAVVIAIVGGVVVFAVSLFYSGPRAEGLRIFSVGATIAMSTIGFIRALSLFIIHYRRMR